MAISLASLKSTTVLKPPRMVVFGPAGVGKTTFATSAPKPVVIQTEEGLGMINVPHFDLARTWEDVMGAFHALFSEDHQFETLVVDSIDWLEPLVQAEACRRNNWKSIEDPGYGKGYVAAAEVWREYLDAINAVRDHKNMAIIQIAHHDIRRFDSPETEPYDRYVLKLHKRAAELVSEHADMILFAGWRVATVKADAGFGQKVTRGQGRGERVLYTEERPAYVAKNRHGLPPELPLEWGAFAAAMSTPSAADTSAA